MPKHYVDLETPIGTMRIVGDAERIDRVDLPKSAACAPDPTWKQARETPPAALDEARRQLTEYFAGTRRAFDLPLAAGGTPFQQRVWDALRRIPYGETISYGELARRIGQPTASRAVGAANGRNLIAIVVPCHRVIGADGTLIGYGGGLPVKEALLALERRAATAEACRTRRTPPAGTAGHRRRASALRGTSGTTPLPGRRNREAS